MLYERKTYARISCFQIRLIEKEDVQCSNIEMEAFLRTKNRISRVLKFHTREINNRYICIRFTNVSVLLSICPCASNSVHTKIFQNEYQRLMTG